MFYDVVGLLGYNIAFFAIYTSYADDPHIIVFSRKLQKPDILNSERKLGLAKILNSKFFYAFHLLTTHFTQANKFQLNPQHIENVSFSREKIFYKLLQYYNLN